MRGSRPTENRPHVLDDSRRRSGVGQSARARTPGAVILEIVGGVDFGYKPTSTVTMNTPDRGQGCPVGTSRRGSSAHRCGVCPEEQHMLLSALTALAMLVTQTGGQPTRPPYLCNYAKVGHLQTASHWIVRAGPGVRFPNKDGLQNGAVVYVCNERLDWWQISYSGLVGPCGALSPGGLHSRKAQACRSGWVNRKWIDILSG